ncbi:MAG: hypothetical protein SGPRY_011085, partial [Prymnesium sp.]
MVFSYLGGEARCDGALLCGGGKRLTHLAGLVSAYVRAYKEHQCKFIFQFDQLELGELASRH